METQESKMTLEEYLVRKLELKGMYDSCEKEFTERTRSVRRLEIELEARYIADNAKFKIGDHIRIKEWTEYVIEDAYMMRDNLIYYCARKIDENGNLSKEPLVRVAEAHCEKI